MLRNFFSSGKKTAALPDGLRLYAIGDIHGRADLLDTLLTKIDDDCKGADAARLVFLGDYVDRGPDSAGVIERLLRVKADRPDSIFLKGNHEAVLLDFLNDPKGFDHWLDWGGYETLESYGVGNGLGKTSLALAEALLDALPDPHHEFLKSLPLTHQAGDYFFVHAGVRPGVPIEEQAEEDLIWIRKRFHNAASHERPDQVVVHGHQPIKAPHDYGWRINLDSGAVWSEKLSAVVLSGTERKFLTT